jgi:hypothetical protein
LLPLQQNRNRRHFFDPPQQGKAKTRLNLKSLLVRRPSTSKLTDTGRTIEGKRWQTATVKTIKVHPCTLRRRLYLDKEGWSSVGRYQRGPITKDYEGKAGKFGHRMT